MDLEFQPLGGHDDEVAFALYTDPEDFLVDRAIADAVTVLNTGRNMLTDETAKILIGLSQRLILEILGEIKTDKAHTEARDYRHHM